MRTTILLALTLAACKGDDTPTDTDTPATDTDVVDTDEPLDTDEPVDTDLPPTPECDHPAFTGPTPNAWHDFQAGAEDLTASGGVTFVAGRIGQGVALDGTGHLDGEATWNPSEMTWAGWIRVDALPDTNVVVANLRHGGQVSYSGWVVVIDPDGLPFFVTQGGGSSTEISTYGTTTFTVGTWHHLAATFASGVARIYVDGLEQGSTVVPNTELTEGTTGYVLGHHAHNQSQFVTGALDEVGYWTVALSAAEITDLVASGTCTE